MPSDPTMTADAESLRLLGVENFIRHLPDLFGHGCPCSICVIDRVLATYAECERLRDALAVEVASVAEQRGTIEQLIALNAQLRSRLGDEEDYPEFPPALAVQIGYGRTATFTPRGSRE